MARLPVEPTADPHRGQSSGGLGLPEGSGACSTRPGLTGDTTTPVEAGIDTLKLHYETAGFVGPEFEIDELPGWHFGSMPSLGLTWAEGHPAGRGELASSEAVARASELVRGALHERVGVMADRGVARADHTVTTLFRREPEARAFFAGMAAVNLPRTETTRRGRPPHSISWTHPQGRKILARCYDKGLQLGGDPWRLARMEDQSRYASGRRPEVERVCEPGYARERFVARFGKVREAVEGVTAATFPVIAQALADEYRYGYRRWQEVERLAGTLVLLSGGVRASEFAHGARDRSTFYRRRRELAEAGYVVVDDQELVSVNLGDVVDQAIEEADWR